MAAPRDLGSVRLRSPAAALSGRLTALAKGRGRITTAGTVIVIGAAVLASLWGVGQPVETGTSTSGLFVSGVAVGSQAWVAGVRPGMPVIGGPEASGLEVDTGPAVIGLAGSITADPGLVLGAVLIALLAVLVGSLGLPGRSALIAASTGVATVALAAVLGFPRAYLLALMPLTLGLMSVAAGANRRHLILLGASAASGAALVLAWANIRGDAPWTLVWAAPMVSGVAATLVVGIATARRRLAMLPTGRPGSTRARISELFPLVRSTQLAARERERAMIASSLHNDVLPRLALSIDQLEAAGGSRGASWTLQHLGRDLRSLMNDRQHVVLDQAGLREAIAGVIETRPDLAQRMRWEPAANDGRPPRAVELAAYRVAQQALINAAEHSRAARIVLALRVSTDAVDLSIADDGIGLVVGWQSRTGRGTGIPEMRQWAESVGAHLELGTAPGEGTRVRFRWQR